MMTPNPIDSQVCESTKKTKKTKQNKKQTKKQQQQQQKPIAQNRT